MAKLHELLAAEKTTNAAWAELLTETTRKFKNPTGYFQGQTRRLHMIEESDANSALEAEARVDKPVVTSVYETLEWMLSIYQRAETLQYQKNTTNREAVATVMLDGEPFLEDLPIDELLGLESRLMQIRKLFQDVPTLDASKEWQPVPALGRYIYETKHAIEKVKTDKRVQVERLAPPTEHHPEQVHVEHRDVPVGRFRDVFRSGEATAVQKSNAIKRIDDLLIAVKQARTRANETPVVETTIADDLVDYLLEPFSVT